jgi:hypothetical protein
MNRCSSKLNLDYTLLYGELSLYNSKTFTGYKLVMDQIENQYSVGTGLYRYKTGRVKRKESDYSVLYNDTEFYLKDMVDRVAVFKTLEDLYTMYPNVDQEAARLAIMKFKLSGDLIELEASNTNGSITVIAGKNIDYIKRI